MDLDQRTRTSQSFIYVDCGARPLPFAFPNSTSAESAFLGRVNHRLTSFFSFLPSRLVGFVSQLNEQLSPTSLQFANG